MSKARIYMTKQLKVNITSSIDVSPDQSYFSIVTRVRGQKNSMYDYKLELYDLNSYQRIKSALIYSSYNERTHPCKILSDSKTIIVATINQIYFYDNNLNLKHKQFHNLLFVYDMQTSPDSKLVALVGDKQIAMWDTLTYKRILFPAIRVIIKSCKFSPDNTLIGVVADMTIYFYRIKPFGQTYMFQLSSKTDSLDQGTLKQLQSNGAFSTFDFNPHNNMEIVIGFGNASPRKVNFQNRTIRKVASLQQPFQNNNFKVVRFLPDGKRVISGDYNQGVGYWPGQPDGNLVYKDNFIFLGVKPYAGGRKVLGFVWQTVKSIQIQFQCSTTNFATSCDCPAGQYWDMSMQMCQSCQQGQTNICVCKQGFNFNPDVAACVFDCSKTSNALNTLYQTSSTNTCFCNRGYIWSNGQCVFDCNSIMFASGPSSITQTCECKPNFTWNTNSKVCQCGQNKRLVTSSDQQTVQCQCIQNYFLDSNTNKCMVNCTSIAYAKSLNQINCQCNEGFYFITSQNITAINSQNKSFNDSRIILSAKTASCIKNCSLIKNTIGPVKADQCLCVENMKWNGTDCVLNCKSIENGVDNIVVNGVQACTCSLSYNWVPQNRQCGRNCDNVRFVNKSKNPTALSCPCIDTFAWSGTPINQCVIDCKKINFSQSYSIQSTSSCTCRNLFHWDNESISCVVNCTEIWDAEQRISVGQCKCKNNKLFNTTSFICQSTDAQSAFSKPWVWAVLAIAGLFIIFVGAVMIKFCCKFSDNKDNKQHNKKLKKNTQPKIKKKKKQQNILTSQRVNLNKQ